MNQSKIYQLAKDIAIDIIAGSFIALGLYNFAASAKFPMVGFNGIALILYQLFGFPMGVTVLLMNIPVIFLCFKVLGKRFFVRSIRSLIISSVLIDVVAPLFPLYEGDRLLSALCCGVLSGLGYGLIYMNDSSTGGMDFITLSIQARHPYITLGKINFIVDAVTVLLGTIIVSKDMDSLIFGFIVSYLMSAIVDKVMYGIDEGKVTLIVTDYGMEMCRLIDEQYGRGSTILNGIGSYTCKEKDVVMCACSSKQMHGIRKLIKTVDEKAFMVIMESNEVVGEGFIEE